MYRRSDGLGAQGYRSACSQVVGQAPDDVREHLSRDYVDVAGNTCGVDELEEKPFADPNNDAADHGTIISGLIAAQPNGLGVAGICWDCSIAMMRVAPSNSSTIADRTIRGLDQVKRDGVQVVNMSFGVAEPPCPPGDLRILCTSLKAAAARDIVLVASAGNDRAGLELPANDPDVIGVGGLEWTGVGPDDQPTAALWDEFPNCPYAGEPGFPAFFECGSSFGPELDLAAPAWWILSTAYTGFDQNKKTLCGDTFLAGGPGYGGCTGTSMSAAEVTAVVAAVRSVNPLLDRFDIYDVLTSTASQAGNHTDQTGFGYPRMAAAVRVALGEAGGVTLTNRLTPFFSFFGVAANQDPATNPDFQLAETHVYTTVPSIASALLLDAVDPFLTIGPVVPGYPAFPQTQCTVSPCDTLPGASIYVFTTAKAPFPGAPPLVPLYRLRYDPDIFADCDPSFTRVPDRDFAFTTTVEGVLYFKNNVVDANGVGYDPDGIEGYIFRSCEGEPGCVPPPGTVRVYRMYHPDRDDYAVFPETELAAMVAQGYQQQPGLATVLGYAYPNVNSDGDTLIDGFERLIGTNPAVADSDCDGLSDGAEILIYDRALHRYGDPRVGPCGVIFMDGFEAGDLSRWSAVEP